MIVLTYGSATFPEVSIRGRESKPVKHGPDKIYTEHIIHTRVLLTLPFTDKRTFDTYETDIRPTFFKPRQSFVLTVNGREWYSVQAPDQDWGPEVLYDNVVQVIGPKAAYVDVGWRLAIADKPNDIPLVLSHRWTTEEVTNNRYWVGRIITGEVILNSKKMIESHPANSLYQVFLQPIPFGYKRDNVQITTSQDGLVIRYSYIDQQLPYVTIPWYVSDCSVSVTGSVSQPSSDDTFSQALSLGNEAIQGGIGAFQNYLGLQAFQNAIDDPSHTIRQRSSASQAQGRSRASLGAGLAGTAANLALNGIAMALKQVPALQFQCQAVVYGLPYAQMNALHDFATYLVVQRLKNLPEFSTTLDFLASTSSNDTRQRVVSYTATVQRSAVKTGLKDWLGIGPAELSPQPAAADLETYMRNVIHPGNDTLKDAIQRTTDTVGKKPLLTHDNKVQLIGAYNFKPFLMAALSVGETADLDKKILVFQPAK